MLLAGHRTTSAGLVCQDILSALLKGHQTGKSNLLSGLEGFGGADLFVGFFRAEIVVHPLVPY